MAMIAANPIHVPPAAADQTPRPDYARRIDELGRIITAYSDITARLQQSHEQLTSTVHRLRAELGEKNELLERKSRLAALGEMAAGMAHEIRNPLGGIQLYASLLGRDLADRPDSLDLVRKISGGVRRLENIVGQVLQFSRDVRVQRVDADLCDIVDQAVDDARAVCAGRNVHCDLGGPRPFHARVDPQLLGQAILNLLLNAAEAIGQDGRIVLRWSSPPAGSEAKHFHLSVIDSGPGIDPDALDRIFNPFFTTRETGTGLGLSIVHRVVESHDGAITAQNQPGGGAKFEIRI